MKKLILLLCLMPFMTNATPDFDAEVKSFRETLAELVKADTTNPPGNEARAVKIIAKRLKAEKIPFEIVEFAPGRENIVARLKGSGPDKPLMLLAHLDVVGTKDQKWSEPDHELTEKDGFLYGRGVYDDFGMGVVNLETFIALKREKIPLKRDVILAFTGDEESGGLGIQYLLEHRPELVNAGLVLNEGGACGEDDDYKMKSINLQGAEKTYSDFNLIAKGETGHSSVPKANNAIYKLAAALKKIGDYKAEERFIPLTRAYFEGRAKVEKPEMAKAIKALLKAKGKLPESALKIVRGDPRLAVALKTTCVATMLSGGTKVNALPPEARANVNCRILPDETVAQVKARLEKIIGDPEITIETIKDFGHAEPSPVDGEVPQAVREVSQEFFPGTPVIPFMASGATDSRFLRARGQAAYGLVPLPSRDADILRMHGVDERIQVKAIRPGLEYWYRLVTRLASVSN